MTTEEIYHDAFTEERAKRRELEARLRVAEQEKEELYALWKEACEQWKDAERELETERATVKRFVKRHYEMQNECEQRVEAERKNTDRVCAELEVAEQVVEAAQRVADSQGITTTTGGCLTDDETALRDALAVWGRAQQP